MVFKQVERKSTISVKVSTNLANVFREYEIQVKQKCFLYSEQEKYHSHANSRYKV